MVRRRNAYGKDHTFYQVVAEFKDEGFSEAISPEFASLEDAMLAARHMLPPKGATDMFISHYATAHEWPQVLKSGLGLGAPEFAPMKMQPGVRAASGVLGRDIEVKSYGEVRAVADYALDGTVQWVDPEWQRYTAGERLAGARKAGWRWFQEHAESLLLQKYGLSMADVDEAQAKRWYGDWFKQASVDPSYTVDHIDGAAEEYVEWVAGKYDLDER